MPLDATQGLTSIFRGCAPGTTVTTATGTVRPVVKVLRVTARATQRTILTSVLGTLGRTLTAIPGITRAMPPMVGSGAETPDPLDT